MTRPRVLGITVIVLLAASLLLAVRTVQLSRRLDHAEVYVQSGSSSFVIICSTVASALRSGDVSPGLVSIASACIGTVTREEAQQSATEQAYKNHKAIADRIEDRVNRRQLPYHDIDSDRSSMPEGYR